MNRRTEIPVNPRVLTWAVETSGLTCPEIADRIGVPDHAVRDWMKGVAAPGRTEFRRLATTLRRPEATFFLPSPPDSEIRVAFRAPPGVLRDRVNAEEARWLREAVRLRDHLAWVRRESGAMPSAAWNGLRATDPEATAAKVRRRIEVSTTVQTSWSGDGAAFAAWREALERLGIDVFALPLGADSCRGFSLPSEDGAVIVVNTAFNVAARIFTLFHEVGHLVRGDAVGCFGGGLPIEAHFEGSEAERWCDEFAAAFLLPADDLRAFLAGEPTREPIDVARSVARRFHVSVRAALLRLIRTEILPSTAWSAYRTLSDAKREGGGGTGRDRLQMRVDQIGRSAVGEFAQAVRSEILTAMEAADALDVPLDDFEELVAGRR